MHIAAYSYYFLVVCPGCVPADASKKLSSHIMHLTGFNFDFWYSKIYEEELFGETWNFFPPNIYTILTTKS